MNGQRSHVTLFALDAQLTIHMAMTIRKNLPIIIGQKFGRLVVEDFAGRNSSGQPHWICRCTCGQPRIVYAQNLLHGLTQSCGCLQKERSSNVNTRHGDAGKGEWKYLYQTWLKVRQRCHNPNDSSYSNYGGRGIQVCEEWRNSYEAFAEYVLSECGARPQGYSIDRIDNDGHYEPGNVRWADRKTQRANSRATVAHLHTPAIRQKAITARLAKSTSAESTRQGGAV